MNIGRFMSKVAGAVSLLLLLATAGFPQSYRGRVQGVVTDQTEAVIGGATVTLLNVATGVKVVKQSSETGLYLFDLVDPGAYTITVEAAGFNKFIQENITVQMRGDVTVNALMKPGAVQESITVTEAPVAVQFNSANKDFTLDSKMTGEIPRIDRNPFKLTLLAPSAVNTRGEMMPYHSWAANSVDLGGGTNLKNDLQVDGSPIGLGHKNSYPPNTDAVQEVVVSQNSVDAESGHSAGGLISMTLKSGTNDWHGTGFYLGRYPWLNAQADRTRFTKNADAPAYVWRHARQRDHQEQAVQLLLAGTLEGWVSGQLRHHGPDVARAGRRLLAVVQHRRRAQDRLRSVHDDSSTRPQARSRERLLRAIEFPQSRFDPLSASLVKDFWDPNCGR